MREYKKPGMTLAESLGIKVPDDAPGGQKLPPPAISNKVARAEPQNAAQIEYDGFFDHDGFARGD